MDDRRKNVNNRRVMDHGPSYERRKLEDRRIVPLYCHEERRQLGRRATDKPIYSYNFELDAEKIIATGAVARERRAVDYGPGCRGRPDKPLEVDINTTNEEINRHLEEHHASGRQLAKDQGPHETAEEYHRRKAIESEETHPGYVKGADKSVKEGIRELSRRLLEESKIRTAELLFGIPISELKAEVKHFTKHSGVTDVLKGVKREPSKYPELIKADPPGSGQLEAVPARCDNCLFYAPTVFGVTSSGAPLPTIIGECQRQAPMLNGSVVFPVVWPTMFESDWCGEHKRKV